MDREACDGHWRGDGKGFVFLIPTAGQHQEREEGNSRLAPVVIAKVEGDCDQIPLLFLRLEAEFGEGPVVVGRIGFVPEIGANFEGILLSVEVKSLFPAGVLMPAAGIQEITCLRLQLRAVQQSHGG